MPAVQDRAELVGGAGDSDDERRHGDDAVVRAEDAGPQPVQPLSESGAMCFAGVRHVGHELQSTTGEPDAAPASIRENGERRVKSWRLTALASQRFGAIAQAVRALH